MDASRIISDFVVLIKVKIDQAAKRHAHVGCERAREDVMLPLLQPSQSAHFAFMDVIPSAPGPSVKRIPAAWSGFRGKVAPVWSGDPCRSGFGRSAPPHPQRLQLLPEARLAFPGADPVPVTGAGVVQEVTMAMAAGRIGVFMVPGPGCQLPGAPGSSGELQQNPTDRVDMA